VFARLVMIDAPLCAVAIVVRAVVSVHGVVQLEVEPLVSALCDGA
jgi:hypothetical protein